MSTYVDLFVASSVTIKRHIKIKAEATTYARRFIDYFKKRERQLGGSSLKNQNTIIFYRHKICLSPSYKAFKSLSERLQAMLFNRLLSTALI